MISNFFQFNPKASLKRVWTDAHTALGLIGLPFQLIYAITGAYFGLSILVLIPANFLYNGNQQKLMDDLRPDLKSFEWVGELDAPMPSVNAFVKENYSHWEHFEPQYLLIKNYGGKNMHYELVGELNDKERFISSGILSYNVSNQKITEILNPKEVNYISDVQKSMGRLHFGDYGNYWVRVVYFIMALITCFVIITGVLIWIEARNKKKMTLKQRKFTARVGHVYLAISQSLLPVIALFFIVMKLLPTGYQTQKMKILYNGFFTVWLILSVLFYLKKDNYFVNKAALLIIVVLGFLIPITNGIVSNNWMWNTYANKHYHVFLVDVLWLIIAIVAGFVFKRIKPKQSLKSTFVKNPI